MRGRVSLGETFNHAEVARANWAFALCSALLLVPSCAFDETNVASDSPRPQATEGPESKPLPAPYAERVAAFPAEWTEQQKVEALLLSYCGDCHSVCDPEALCAGMEYVDDMQELIRQGKVIPGDPDSSPLIQRMPDGNDAHGTPLPLPPVDLIERVSAFIESLCPAEGVECD